MRSRRRRVVKLGFTFLMAIVYFLPIAWMVKSSFQTERATSAETRIAVPGPSSTTSSSG